MAPSTCVEEVDECLKVEKLRAHLIAVDSTRHVVQIRSVVRDVSVGLIDTDGYGVDVDAQHVNPRQQSSVQRVDQRPTTDV